jgi:hypothetical protein
MVPLPEYAPGSLSPLVRSVSPSDRGDSVLEEEATTGGYDVFISHATEDKDEIVRRLASELVLVGLRVWYDEFELRLGDSLRRKIDAGLARSRFGGITLVAKMSPDT